MKLNNIKTNKRKRKKRLGRGPGSGRGKTCGRGNNGQFQRSGAKRNPGFAGGAMSIIRKIPKRGMSKGSKQTRMLRRKNYYTCINLKQLNVFKDKAKVTKKHLYEKKLIKSPAEKVKVLGNGELKKTLFVECDAFSKSAKEKIESQQGKADLIVN